MNPLEITISRLNDERTIDLAKRFARGYRGPVLPRQLDVELAALIRQELSLPDEEIDVLSLGDFASSPPFS